MRDSKALRIALYILLFGCIITYIKIYVIDVRKNKYVDLPKKVTDVRWYKYDDYSTLEFSVGNIKTNDEKLSKCTKYTYDSKDKKIILNCNEYNMKLISVSKYKLMIMVDQGTKSDTVTYYKYKEIIDYMIENEIDTISEDDIEENIELPKRINDSDYRNAQMNKLTTVKELTINELNDVLHSTSNSLILIINPNMKTTSYNIIPIFVNWKNKYNNYKYYYINGKSLNANDKILLEQFDDLSINDYIVGLNDLNMIHVKDREYKFINVSINTIIEHNEVFDCDDDCDDIDISLKDGEKKIKISELLK